MLTHLHIENYALIDRLEIDFSDGLSVITGETGAGKSIILGALGLILGQRADLKSFQNAEKKCVIEAEFNLSGYNLETFFVENDLDYSEHTTIRRELLASGKSRSFVNDTPVPVSVLRELGDRLIDIHSQHQNLLLSNDDFQLHVVDSVANNRVLLTEYQKHFQQYKKHLSELDKLTAQATQAKNDEEYFRFQYQQLSNAGLKAGEQTELEAELETLTHSEEIKTVLAKLDYTLSDDERGVISALSDSRNALSSISRVSGLAQELGERVSSCLIELKDIASELGKQNDSEYSPERTESINRRLDLIYSLELKHRVKTVDELIVLEKDFEQKLTAIDNYDEQIADLQNNIDKKLIELTAFAAQLSEQRKKSVPKIEEELASQLSGLGMPNVRFEVKISERDALVPTSAPATKLNIYGADEIAFYFSANKNTELQPVARIASGGETARVMLCIKSLLSASSGLPTIIFDEIDTGVSGEIADRMGYIMKQISSRMQVIAITHLPQIAAKGSAHYKVYKTDNEHSTNTHIKQLTDEQRISEIAQMLSGSSVTEAALNNAKTLLKN